MKHLFTSAATALVLAVTTPAFAGPILSIEVFDGLTQVGSTVFSSTGAIGFVGHDSNFSDIQVAGQGAGVLVPPDLSTTSLQATVVDKKIPSPITLTVDIFQTGLVPFTGEQATTGTYNALIGTPPAAVENMFVDGSIIVTDTVTPPVTAFGPENSALVNATSDEEQYEFTFNKGGQSSAGTMQFVASTVVNEPSTLGLLAFGLLATWAWLNRGKRGYFLGLGGP